MLSPARALRQPQAYSLDTCSCIGLVSNRVKLANVRSQAYNSTVHTRHQQSQYDDIINVSAALKQLSFTCCDK